jgi:hypothetical protein
LNSRAPRFYRRARKLSDIVKRRSIRVLRAAVKPWAARYSIQESGDQGSGRRSDT